MQELNEHLLGIAWDASLEDALSAEAFATPLDVMRLPRPLGRDDADKVMPGKWSRFAWLCTFSVWQLHVMRARR